MAQTTPTRTSCLLGVSSILLPILGVRSPINPNFRAFGLVSVEFNVPPDTVEVISEAVFTASHLTDTDRQNSTGKYKQTQYKSEKVNNLKYSKTIKTTLVQLLLTTLGQETRWAYSTTPPRAHTGPQFWP